LTASWQACIDPSATKRGAENTEGNMRHSRQPRRGHAHVLLARARHP